MPPIVIAAAITAGGAVASGVGQARAASGAQKDAANPYQHQLDRAGAMTKLDFLENASYSKPTFSGKTTSVGRVKVPEISGGFSYERSPELRAGAGALKRDVMRGRDAKNEKVARDITVPELRPDGKPFSWMDRIRRNRAATQSFA